MAPNEQQATSNEFPGAVVAVVAIVVGCRFSTSNKQQATGNKYPDAG